VSLFFASVVVPRTTYTALERIIAAFNFEPEKVIDHSWHVAEVIGEPVESGGKRVWWRVKNTYETYYLSVDPGECRTSQPGDGIIMDVPPGDPKITCRQVLQAAVTAAAYSPPVFDENKELLVTAERLLNGGRDIPEAFKAHVRSAIDIADMQQYQSVFDALYESYFTPYRCNTLDFTCAILLLQFQRATAVRIQEDWLSDPNGYLFGFLEQSFESQESRPLLIRTVTDFCNSNYEIGRSDVERALSAESWERNTRRLALACHRLQIVRLLQHFLSTHKIWPTEMAMPAVLAEEAFVCARTGLMQGARFCSMHPDSWARSILRAAGRSPTIAALKYEAHLSAREIEPTFTRQFADILAAQALSLAPGHELEGLGELENIRKTRSDQVGFFERGWLDRCLLEAYRATGNEPMIRRTAASIAGQLVMDQLLSELRTK
jgi:hypothetical protein